MTTPKLRFKEFDGDWSFSKIGEIFQVTSGSTPLRSDKRFFKNADITWVKTTDLNNGLITKTEEKISQIALKETSVKILPKGTVFIAMYGGFNQIGRTGLLLNEAACNQALSAIYPNEKIDPFFLLTYLNHKVDDWKSFAASSRKDPNITKSDVLAFPFIYPSKQEQTKIASFLSAVDEKISQLNQKHALLSQYKQGMMQKLFSQQIRFKADDGSEFGAWETKEIKEIADVKGGKRLPKGYSLVSENTSHPYLTVSDMNRTYGIDSENIRYVPLEVVDVIKRYTITDQDIFISVAGTLGIIGKIPSKFNGANLTENADKLTNLKCNQDFLIYLLDSGCLSELIESTATTSAQPKLALYAIEQMEVCIPCLEEQTKIANFLSSIDQKIEVVAQQIEQAKVWKKGLLQQMFV